ncbi:hypothetical protein D9615_005557 [Tricholomella constricta]|uniref:Phosphatidylinositol-specific phospholipase C X domain-containing protein n=1 Tax=Tricholomella constricta TaxID=117010 RepID=A0A8H5HEC6_9AGAR|nr:hypothetical protein D9615_005557 [Tricholomella constricta]
MSTLFQSTRIMLASHTMSFDPAKYCNYKAREPATLLAVKDDLVVLFPSAHILILHESNRLHFSDQDCAATYHLETDYRGLFTSTYGYDVYVLWEALFKYDGSTDAGDFLLEMSNEAVLDEGHHYTLKRKDGKDDNSPLRSTDWMKALDDELLLNEITIPGTHNSCSIWGDFIFIANDWAACQSAGHGISWQLNAGIRFLDLRSRWNSRESYLQMCHGIWNTNTRLDDVIRELCLFLHNHLTETILVSIRCEAGDGPAFAQAVHDLIHTNKHHWFLGTSIPSLQTARGKIVLFRRYDEANAPYLAISGSIGGIYNPKFPEPDGTVEAQDDYNPYQPGFSLNDCFDRKRAQVIAMFRKASAAQSPHPLYINFISGYVWSGFFSSPSAKPKEFALEMNKRLHGHLDELDGQLKPVKLGVVVLDFPEQGASDGMRQDNHLIYRLLRANFVR